MKTRQELKKEIRLVYRERNQLVLLLTKIYPSHLSKHTAKEWEDDWRNIVCIHTPKGQATWHIHDTEVNKFGHLMYRSDHWDGHTTNNKYNRLEKIRPPKEVMKNKKAWVEEANQP